MQTQVSQGLTTQPLSIPQSDQLSYMALRVALMGLPSDLGLAHFT